MTSIYRSILVPLDGSVFAEQALPIAIELAQRSHAILQLALVDTPVAALVTSMEMPAAVFQFDEQTRSGEQTYLDGLVQRLAAQHQPVTGVILEGPVAEALESQIVTSATDLVVSTTHGRGHLGRFWLGSVTDQLMRHLHIPIILIRPEEGNPRPRSDLGKILVAVDGSPFAEQAVEHAAAVSLLLGASLELVFVVEPAIPIADPNGMFVMPATLESGRAVHDRAREYVESVARRLSERGVNITSRIVDGGGVAATILEHARVSGAGLIALASHGLGGVERLLLGSVADKVVRGSTVPVLVVRPA